MVRAVMLAGMLTEIDHLTLTSTSAWLMWLIVRALTDAACACMQDKLRNAPLQQLKQPVLFVRGTRDAFCEAEQFDAVLPTIPSDSVKVLSPVT